MELFNVRNFLNSKNVVQNLLKSASNIGVHNPNSGVVAFSQCDDDVGSFLLDTSATRSDPSPVTKGTSVKLDLEGVTTDDINVNNAHIHVDWNGSPLYDDDFANPAKKSDDQLSIELNWDVPSFAPSGHYHVEIRGTDSDGTTNICVNAEFDL